MPELVLYYSPGTCSRVVVVALEHIGIPYRRITLALARAQQHEPDYRRINPLGKVPVLVTDGMALTETIGILSFLDLEFPAARLFPVAGSSMELAKRLSGLSFCAANLHSLVRGLANPGRLTTGDVEPVREKTREVAHLAFSAAEMQLAATGWWLGERSIVDAYLCWAFETMVAFGFDGTPFKALGTLSSRLMEWPAYRTMLSIDESSRLDLSRTNSTR